MPNFDYLVIGGGIAGLTFALEVADHGTVAVLFKKGTSDSSTAWAQGGIAAVSASDDSYESHIADTLNAGAGLCREDVVRVVVEEGPAAIDQLIRKGTKFDKSGEQFHLHQEGGHSHRRIFHSADSTGWEIQRALLTAASAHPNITFFPERNAVDLITSTKLGHADAPNSVLGAYVLNSQGEVETFSASKVLVATGGAGKVYLYTSNPDVASGDGIAICFRAGVPVVNMEFFQFHPTCLFHPKAKNFLLSEALRGEGAKLRRIDGSEFMHEYDARAELAPRDIVARAIDHELKKRGDEYVLLDISHRDPDFIRSHFPSIYERCLSYGYDLTKVGVPVVPAAHYCCGGVETNLFGETTIGGLYAAGECAHTGLHGANRLASNSLLEGVVFGIRAARSALKYKPDLALSGVDIPAWNATDVTDSDEQVIITQNWDEIRRLMWNYVGIVRTNKRLERALRRVELIQKEIQDYYWNFKVTSDLLELRNLALVAQIVIRSSLARKESRGLHYTLDYPEKNPVAVDTRISDHFSCS